MLDTIKTIKDNFSNNISSKITNKIELNPINENKYTIIKNVKINQFGNSSTLTSGILDDTKTLLVASIARLGSNQYKVSTGNNMSRALIYGDVVIYTYRNDISEIGRIVMSSKSWMILQSKKDKEENAPFLRTSWDLKLPTVTGTIQYPMMDSDIKHIVNLSINLSIEELITNLNNKKHTNNIIDTISNKSLEVLNLFN